MENQIQPVLTDEQFRRLEERNRYEEFAARQLGSNIGYGRMMQLAQQLWRESLIKQGYPPGGEFAYGPCVALTVPCGCQGSCDWCNGAGWLTHKVKAVKDSMGE